MPEPMLPLNTPLGLRGLEAQDTNLISYLESLPEYIRVGLRQHSDEIHSEEDLKRFVDQLKIK